MACLPAPGFAILTLVLVAVPSTAQTLSAVADLYEARRYADAATALERVPEAAGSLGLVWGARIALARGQHDDAIAALELAVARGLVTKGTHLWLARSYAARAQAASIFGALRAARLAKRHWDLALRHDPGDLDARSDLVGFHLTAPRIAGGDRRQADVQATEVAQRDAYAGALERARIAAHDKRHAEVERIYRGLIEGYPERSAAYAQLAMGLEADARWTEVSDLLARWKAAAPTDPLPAYHRGRSAAMSGTALDSGWEALREYLAAPERRGRPSHGDAHYLRGVIAWKRGDVANARRLLALALEMEPDHRAARSLLAKVGRP